MKQRIAKMLTLVHWFMGTTKAYVVALVLLCVQSIWLIFSAIYPLPFDEYYHVGIIKIYAQQWSPFISAQPTSASLYGDITRVPSYLYHYLMSFPYRFFDVFIEGEVVLVILMRLINLAFVVGAIILFRKLFLRAGISQRVVNVAVLFFVITPITPFLAAHVNYDNLMLLLTPVVLGAGYEMYKNKKLDTISLAIFFNIGVLTVMVKNSFLPIFAGLAILLFVRVLRTRKKDTLRDISKSWRPLSWAKKVIIVVALLLSVGLVAERYGYNIVTYRSLWPRCERIQSDDTCKHFMPWYRNYQNKLSTPTEKLYGNPLSFTQHWVSKMTRGYFAIFSHTPTNVLVWYEPFGPIVVRPLTPLPVVVASVTLVISFAALAINRNKLWKNDFMRLTLIIATGHLLFLWAFNYQGYLSLGIAQAIQARYTYPLMLLIIVLLITSWNYFKVNTHWKTTAFLVVFFCYAWGGGVSGWIIRSDNLWYWQSSIVSGVNQQTQELLKRVVPH